MTPPTRPESTATPHVEILTFEGCPNTAAAVQLVQRVVRTTANGATIELVEIENEDAARKHGFLGSPSVRVDGRDVEPGADARGDAAFACRLYATAAGLRGVPDEAWLRDALERSTRA